MRRCSVDSHRVMAPETGSLHQERAPIFTANLGCLSGRLRHRPWRPPPPRTSQRAKCELLALARGLQEKLDPSGTLFFGQTLSIAG